jgi:hypothetical protein
VDYARNAEAGVQSRRELIGNRQRNGIRLYNRFHASLHSSLVLILCLAKLHRVFAGIHELVYRAQWDEFWRRLAGFKEKEHLTMVIGVDAPWFLSVDFAAIRRFPWGVTRLIGDIDVITYFLTPHNRSDRNVPFCNVLDSDIQKYV